MSCRYTVTSSCWPAFAATGDLTFLSPNALSKMSLLVHILYLLFIFDGKAKIN